jgi:hypothetical protein
MAMMLLHHAAVLAAVFGWIGAWTWVMVVVGDHCKKEK